MRKMITHSLYYTFQKAQLIWWDNRAQQQPQQQMGSASGPNFGGRQAPRQPVAQQRRPQPYSNRGQQNRQNRGGQNRQNRGGQNRQNRSGQQNTQNRQNQAAIGRAMAQTLMSMLRDQF